MAPSAPPLIDRIVRDLLRGARPRTTVDLAGAFLAAGEVSESRAEELLGALLARDPRLVRSPEGWIARDLSRAEGPENALLTGPAVAVFAPRQPLVAAMTTTGGVAGGARFSVAAGGEAEVRRAEERLDRPFPRPVVDLTRVCRRLRGYRGPGSPVNLAEAIGAPHVEAEDARSLAAVAAAVFERLAGELFLEGVQDLGELERLLEQKLEPADFSGKEFGPEDLAGLPPAPGVYLFRDARGGALYVGQSRCVAARVTSYFVGPPRDEKDRTLRTEAAGLVVRTVDSAPDALLWEARWIRRRRPRLNVRLTVRGEAEEDGILALHGCGERPKLVLFVLRGGGLRLRIAAAPGPRRRELAIARSVAALFDRFRRDAVDREAATLLSFWRRTHPETLFLRPAVDGGRKHIAGRLRQFAGLPERVP
jgi:hypothetical protein